MNFSMAGQAPPMARIATARALLLAGASGIALAISSPVAFAQSVNYGALEELYGEPVTTSATGKPQKASEAPANLEIITQDDIRRSGADNIPDILQFVTGMNVRRYGFGDASVSVRGLNQPQSPRLLVLLNGRQVYQDDYGYVAWQAIPVELDEIRQIEVVKRPNSALFGFNAVGGVINIITYDPLYDTVNTVTARTGTQSLAEGDVVATVHAGDQVGVRVSAGGYLAHEFMDPYADALPPFSPTRGSISADSRVRLAPGMDMTLSASETSSQSVGEIPAASMFNEYWRTNSVRAGMSAESPIGTLNLNFYRNELYYANNDSYPEWRNVVYVAQANDILKVNEDNTIRFGLEYRNNAMVDTSDLFIGHEIGYQVYSASGMWNWQITPRLSFTNAVRGDYLALSRSGPPETLSGFPLSAFNDRRIFEPSFNSGLVYQLTDHDTFRLMAARGVGLPSLAQFGLFFSGNPDLHPTVVDNYELDYDRELPAIGSVLRTAVFYQSNKDLLISFGGPIPAGTFLPLSQNVGGADETGLEIGIKGHSASGFRWNASYSFASVTEHVISNKQSVPDTAFDYMKGTPQHTIIVGVGYTWEKYEFDAFARWQSRYRDYFTPLFPEVPLSSRLISDYVTATARIGCSIKPNVVLALTAQQLNSAVLRETAFIPVERRLIASFTAHF